MTAGAMALGAGKDPRPSRLDARRRQSFAMPVALSIALLAHALLILGVGFRLPEPRSLPPSSLEVMVVTQPGPAPAEQDPDAVPAQHDRAGETRVPLPELDQPLAAVVADAVDALQPEPAMDPPAEAPLEPAPAPPAEDEAAVPPEPAPAPLDPEPSDPEPQVPDTLVADEAPAAVAPPPISAAQILASRGAEISRLTASIDQKRQAYASRARRKAISTATREYRYASYMEAWRRKVERIGNLNYPQEARREGLFGNLILHVAVRADGSLEGVRVIRSSGHQLLDEAAINIVELAAPFAPFPADIKAETDVLDITRTWQFQRNNRLGWDN
jgi:protein TonB